MFINYLFLIAAIEIKVENTNSNTTKTTATKTAAKKTTTKKVKRQEEMKLILGKTLKLINLLFLCWNLQINNL